MSEIVKYKIYQYLDSLEIGSKRFPTMDVYEDHPLQRDLP